MGTLALDIETSSPFEEPPENSNDHRYYEWLSVAVAYVRDGQVEPETAVMFRQGGWDDEYTAGLLNRLVDWCANRDVDRTLTYNGDWFDLKLMAGWAEELEQSGMRPNAVEDLMDCVPRHVDVALAAKDRHEDELWEDQVILPDWKAYQLEGINNKTIWYDNYDFNDDYLPNLGIEDEMVKGVHVGQALGKQYVDGVVAGIEDLSTHRELKRLLYDYSLSDIVDLHRLYLSLGGEDLDQEYHYPVRP